MSFAISVNVEIWSLSSGMTWGKQSVWVTTQTRGKGFQSDHGVGLMLITAQLNTNGKHSGKQISHYKSPHFESNHRHEKVVQEMVPIHIYHFVLSSMDLFMLCIHYLVLDKSSTCKFKKVVAWFGITIHVVKEWGRSQDALLGHAHIPIPPICVSGALPLLRCLMN